MILRLSSSSFSVSSIDLKQNDRYRCVSSANRSPSKLWPNRRSSAKNYRSVIPSFGSGAGLVAENSKTEIAVVPTSVPVRVAQELVQAGHRYLDVRTAEEFSAGHVAGAVNVPYMIRRGTGLTSNPYFLEQVLDNFTKDDEIIVGCQSGKRSLSAVTELLSFGFSGVVDMAGGYATWTQNGLPIE